MLLLEKKIEESVVTTVKEYIKTGQIPLKISPELSLSGKKFLTSWKTTYLFYTMWKGGFKTGRGAEHFSLPEDNALHRY